MYCEAVVLFRGVVMMVILSHPCKGGSRLGFCHFIGILLSEAASVVCGMYRRAALPHAPLDITCLVIVQVLCLD